MHRSGTSFAANALRLLGVSFGDPDQLLAPGADNPAGYWENRPIKELDDEVLAELGGSWDQPPVLTEGWAEDARLDELRARATEALRAAFGDTTGIVAWKDPRLSLVLPFWRTVTDITTSVVIVRHPVEVAKSLHARNGMDAPRASALWLRYVLAALRNDPGHLMLRQTDFYADLPGTLDAIASHLGLDAPSAGVVASISEALDPGMRHHVADAAASAPADPVTQLALDVWNDGHPDPEAFPEPVVASLAEGWLRSPEDAAELSAARAKVVKLESSLRRRELAKAKLDARRAKLDQLEADMARALSDQGKN
jgi:hypothetical protein